MSVPVLGTPIYDSIAIGAAVANEVHGTNLKGQGIFADMVVNATWVDGRGIIHKSGNLSTVAGAMGLTGVQHAHVLFLCACNGRGWKLH